MSEKYLGYKTRIAELNEEAAQRYELATGRIKELCQEHSAVAACMGQSLNQYFDTVFNFADKLIDLCEQARARKLKERSLEQCKADNDTFFEDIKAQKYATSYLNPAYATEKLGQEFGGLLSFVFSDFRACIAYAFEGRIYHLTIFLELLLEIYGAFADEEGCDEPMIRDAIYWFYHDYAEIFTADGVLEQIDPEYDFFYNIIMNADLDDLRYLYLYGMHVGENELRMAKFLATLPEEDIERMARTYTEGYRLGFIATQKDISKKSSVCVEFPIGMERVAKKSIEQFEQLGLKATMRREQTFSANGLGKPKRNVFTTDAGRQYMHDHKNDNAYYLDKAIVERRLEVMRDVYESAKHLSLKYGGPAVIEVFGDEKYNPVNKPENARLTDKQKDLLTYFSGKAGEIVNTYIPGEERSYTIISWPLPTIKGDFETIFKKTVEINTLDYMKYQQMQQKIIDVLDKAEYVVVRGKGDNRTDMKVSLLSIKEDETIFENCVADVNIPVGEVFTSPVLKGTEGTLHVSGVYLSGKFFKDLWLTFENGCVTGYGCDNFETEEENKNYVDENIMYFHKTLPIGEFAIGTNTTAYRVGRDLDILSEYDILIAEKCGPHFAVGDTCYSYEEDMMTYNPDGKKIVARSNEFADLRHTDPQKAYFNCHTDITIPYDELQYIRAIGADGQVYSVIEDGLFAVPGTEELNVPLMK